MTPDERAKALLHIDLCIERSERACEEYELIHMEMMAALARAKALHKQLVAKEGGAREGDRTISFRAQHRLERFMVLLKREVFRHCASRAGLSDFGRGACGVFWFCFDTPVVSS